MEDDRKKVGKIAIVLFLSCLSIALVCFGVFVYFALTNRDGGFVDGWIVALSKIVVMIGIFFLVLAFGHLLPVLISHRKHK
ncbi:MAG: hypothetical protein K2O45_05035 [Oscillospiraceae bacterium]|nr:hypothetical protein [Oscillospiraceae bacterium]